MESNTIVYPTVKSGDILVWNDSFKGRSNYGALIRLFTASDFTHVGIALVKGNLVLSAEANVPVVRTTVVQPNDRLYYIPTPVIHDYQGQEFIDGTAGLKYSYLDAARSLFGSVSKKDDRWQCAEYVWEYMKLYGYDLGNAYTPSKIVRSAMREFNTPLIPYYS